MNARQTVFPMTGGSQPIATVAELAAAAGAPGIRTLLVKGALRDVPSLRLAPGQSIRGVDGRAALAFAAGGDGLQLTADNEVQGLDLATDPDRRALFNDDTVPSLGRIRIHDVTATGQVQILARGAVKAGHVDVAGLDIVAADTRQRHHRASGFGVEVLQGAFTLWNMQPDPTSVVSATVTGVSAGRPGAPVIGSGVFVSGGGLGGGRLIAEVVETGAVCSDGRIAPGTPDVITGGVFILHGVVVDLVHNRGPVVTRGDNDMVLDNWGTVDNWIAEQKITSHGPGGAGFVNFGTLRTLEVRAPIETFGQGARGFDVCAGTLGIAEFDRITTHADGAVGVQINQPIDRLVIRRGIETFGGTGPSRVEGAVVTLPAVGLNVGPGGFAREIDIAGGIRTRGSGVAPLEMHGEIVTMRISGRVTGAGACDGD